VRRRLVLVSVVVNAAMLGLMAASCQGLQDDHSYALDGPYRCSEAVQARLRTTYGDGFVNRDDQSIRGDRLDLAWTFERRARHRPLTGTATCTLARDGDRFTVTDLDLRVDE
jgi:hypothetical protein